MLLHVDTATLLAIVSGYVIPAVSALLTHPKWSSAVTGLISLVLGAVSGFVSQWAAAPNLNHYDWKTAALTALASLATAAVGHFVTFKGPISDLLHDVGVSRT